MCNKDNRFHKKIAINSKDRQTNAPTQQPTTLSNTSGNYVINFSYPVDYTDSFVIKKINVPYSFYNVNSYNNVLIFDIGAGDLTITITEGNYNIEELRAELETQLKITDATFSVTYNTITQSTTISRTGNFTLQLSNVLTTINKLIGFGVSDVTGAATYTGTNLPIIAPSHILMFSRVLSRRIDFIQHSGQKNNFLMYLQLDTSQGSYINIDDNNQQIFNLKDSYSFDNIDIYYEDEDGHVIDFRGVDNIFNIEFM